MDRGRRCIDNHKAYTCTHDIYLYLSPSCISYKYRMHTHTHAHTQTYNSWGYIDLLVLFNTTAFFLASLIPYLFLPFSATRTLIPSYINIFTHLVSPIIYTQLFQNCYVDTITNTKLLSCVSLVPPRSRYQNRIECARDSFRKSLWWLQGNRAGKGRKILWIFSVILGRRTGL